MSVVTSSGNSLKRLGEAVESGNIVSALIWFKRDSDSGAMENGFEIVENSSGESYSPCLVTPNDRHQAYGANAGSSAEFGPNPLNTGVWQCVKFTKNATPSMTVKELTDGDTAWGDSVTLTTGLTERNIDEVWIGTGAFGQPAPWTIAFVKIWAGIVLSDADALKEMRYRGVVTNFANVWANYRFKSGALGADSSGNGRTLTLNGTPTHSTAEPNAILGEFPSLPIFHASKPRHYSRRKVV